MKITRAVEHIFQKYLPSPFTIAILLTLITMILAVVFTRPSDTSSINYITDILRFWEYGIWNTKKTISKNGNDLAKNAPVGDTTSAAKDAMQ